MHEVLSATLGKEGYHLLHARSGSLEIEGMAHHSDSSRTSASASACTKASMSATGSS